MYTFKSIHILGTLDPAASLLPPLTKKLRVGDKTVVETLHYDPTLYLLVMTKCLLLRYSKDRRS